MDIVLYNNTSLANKVDKTLENARTLTGSAFVLPYDERFPKIRITGISRFNNHNYFKIPGESGFDKYYYITKVEWKTNKECVISGELDLLMTYKDYIRGLRCYLKRSENHDTPYINDEMDILQVNQTYSYIPFPSGLGDQETDGAYVLTVAQKGYSTNE